jgi:adenylate kinase
MVHLSTGDMLRDAIAQKTETGLKAKDFVENGKLVPDEIIISVIIERLKQEDCVTKGWLLDGFPRSAGQAEALQKNGVVCDVFIQLDVLDNLLLERVVGRRTDPETGRIYHMKFSPPESEEVTARLVQRADDTEEKFTVRLKGYHANTSAILDYFQAKLFSVKVDSASMTPAVIYDIIKAKLDTVYSDNNSVSKKRQEILSTRTSPKDEALDYWENKGVSHLFEFLTTRLLVEKPDNPNQFILAEINKIEKLKSQGRPAVEYNEDELCTMFLAFDVTSKGSISAAQYTQGQLNYNNYYITILLYIMITNCTPLIMTD